VPWQRAQLHAEASGQVTERVVQEGDRVEKGDLLARLEHREEQIALEEARAQLLKARAEFQAKYDGRLARSSGTAAEDSASVSTRRVTQAAVSGLTAARQAVERAKLNLERTRITAPFAGRVANLTVEEGQYVGQGEKVAMLPLLVFPQDGEFWVGMAVTVTGGLLAATLLAPLATVALLQLIDA
jgi:HlyD family secretion protein